MDLTVFVISLAVGGLVVGALFGTVLPRIAGGRLWPIPACIVFAFLGGFVITDLFETEYSVALPIVLALSPFWLVWVSRSSGGGDFSTGSWAGGDSGSGDCGGGGGDGGGGGGCD